MLTIRDEQMAVFVGARRREALARLVAHLCAACAARTRGVAEAQLLAEVEAGVAHARRYGIEAERDLRAFLECRVEYGVDFDAREGWAAAILGDETLFPEEKASLLGDHRLLASLEGGQP